MWGCLPAAGAVSRSLIPPLWPESNAAGATDETCTSCAAWTTAAEAARSRARLWVAMVSCGRVYRRALTNNLDEARFSAGPGSDANAIGSCGAVGRRPRYNRALGASDEEGKGKK